MSGDPVIFNVSCLFVHKCLLFINKKIKKKTTFNRRLYVFFNEHITEDLINFKNVR